MWKSLAAAFITAAALASGLARADRPDEFTQGMETMWEVMWHQSGIPTRLVRWEQDIKVRVTGVNLASHRQATLEALRNVAAEAGVRVIDVSDAADAEQQANVTIAITPNGPLILTQR